MLRVLAALVAAVGFVPSSARAGWLRPVAARGDIAGYASASSVAPGDRLKLFVSAAHGGRYRVDVYRLGWYDGTGARLETCLPSCAGSQTGVDQPEAGPDWLHGGIVKERWQATDVLAVSENWRSGYYVAELVMVAGPAVGTAATVPFVVRPRAGDDSPILVVAPVTTWQAYNDFGGTSFYRGPGGRKASIVSFKRPYDAREGWPAALYYEIPLVRFLEQANYDVTYTTDVDVDRDPSQLLHHRLVIVAGHSEYWTEGLLNAFEAARDAGVNLAFFGGNDAYHNVGYADGDQSVVKHDLFRNLSQSQPECELLGIEWQGGWVGDGVERNSGAGAAYVPSAPYSVDASSLSYPWFAGTGFSASSTVPGIVGYEWDGVEPGCVPTKTVLFRYFGSRWTQTAPWQRGFVSTNADAVAYTAASGATVFSAGSIEFSWGLDGWARRFNAVMASPDNYPPDPRLQQFVRNMLKQLAGPPEHVPRIS